MEPPFYYSLFAGRAGRETSVNLDALPDLVEVPAGRQRVKCSACGARPIDLRPDWREAQARSKMAQWDSFDGRAKQNQVERAG